MKTFANTEIRISNTNDFIDQYDSHLDILFTNKHYLDI